MRIISGYGKGRKLHTPMGNKLVRPTSDRAKEAVFNILGDSLAQAYVLDLFCGTGSFGVEALSRGAASVTFVDNSNTSLDITRKNIATILDALHKSDQPPPKINLHRQDLTKINFSTFFLENNYSNKTLIFLDPPYAKGLSQQVLTKLDLVDNLPENTILVAEESSKEQPPANLSQLILNDTRKYGDTSFWFYKTAV